MFPKIPRSVFILGLVSFFNDIASEMIYPIVPIFLMSVLNAPISVIGLIEGIAEGSASLLKMVFGYWSDRIGKRMVFVINGYSFGAVSKLLIGLAMSWQFVLFARVIDRLGKGLRTSPRDSLLLQNATSQNRGFIFGFHRAMDSFGAVLGPLIALGLLAFFKTDIRTVFFIAFIPGVIGVILLVFFIRDKRPTIPDTKEKEAKRLPWYKIDLSGFNQSLVLFFIISIIFALGNSSDAFLILQAKHLGLTTTLAVLAYVLFNISQTVFATPFGQLADKIGARRVYAGGLLVFALVYLAFGATKNANFLWILFPIYGIYIAATDGVSKAYISEFITEKVSGTYFGLYQTGISLATFFASFIGGLLWTMFTPSVTFYYGAAMAFLAFLVLLYGKVLRKL